jgi:hypothetical protein
MLAGEWRTKTFMFAQALFDPKKATKNAESYKNATSKTQTIPDHPFSIVEKNDIAGKIIFLSDLFRDHDESFWQGYEQ